MPTGFTPRNFTDTTGRCDPSQDERGEEHQGVNLKQGVNVNEDVNLNEQDMNVNEDVNLKSRQDLKVRPDNAQNKSFPNHAEAWFKVSANTPCLDQKSAV